MWFVVVVILTATEGSIVTVAKEVDSRVQCEVFVDKMKRTFPGRYKMSMCTRYIEDGDSR